MISAALGLVAYPAHGMMKSLYTATHSKTRKRIVEARRREGKYLEQHSDKGRVGRQVVLRKFELQQRMLMDASSSS